MITLWNETFRKFEKKNRQNNLWKHVILRIGPFRIIFRKKSTFFRWATQDRATGMIYEHEYLRKLKKNSISALFCCSVWLFCTFWPQITKSVLCFLRYSQKTIILTGFCGFSAEWDFSRKIRLCQFVPFIVLKRYTHCPETSF